jgi:hypothetical protein
MKKNICLLFFYFLCANILAQPVITFQKTIGGTGNDFSSCMALTKDGGVILGGESYSNISYEKTEDNIGAADYWIVKLSSTGEILWDKTIGGAGDDQLSSVEETKDGGYILGGYSSSDKSGDKTQNSRGRYDYWVIKLDSVRNVQWDKTIGGNKNEFLGSIYEMPGGGYVLGGSSRSDISGEKKDSSRGNFDYWVLKLDSAGNIKWSKTIGGRTGDELETLKLTADGGFILGGYSFSNKSGEKTENSRGSDDYWVVKLDRFGKIQWDKTVGGDALDELHALDQTMDGGYILGGVSISSGSGDKSENSRGIYDYWIVKLNDKGKIQWDKTIGGDHDDGCHSIQQTKDSGFIVGGYSASGISGEKTEPAYRPDGTFDYWVVKLDKNHNIEWDKTIGGAGADDLGHIKELKKNQYALFGYSFSDRSFDKSEDDRGQPFCDYWFVNLKDKRNVNASSNIVNIKGTSTPSFSVYPNPAKNVLYVKANGSVDFSIISSQGAIVLQKKVSGNSSVDIANLTSGIYYVKNNSTGEIEEVMIDK